MDALLWLVRRYQEAESEPLEGTNVDSWATKKTEVEEVLQLKWGCSIYVINQESKELWFDVVWMSFEEQFPLDTVYKWTKHSPKGC